MRITKNADPLWEDVLKACKGVSPRLIHEALTQAIKDVKNTPATSFFGASSTPRQTAYKTRSESGVIRMKKLIADEEEQEESSSSSDRIPPQREVSNDSGKIKCCACGWTGSLMNCRCGKFWHRACASSNPNDGRSPSWKCPVCTAKEVRDIPNRSVSEIETPFEALTGSLFDFLGGETSR
jgi:hypothetical protein